MATPGKNTNSSGRDEDARRQLSRNVNRIQHSSGANIESVYSNRHAVITRDPRRRAVAVVPGSSLSAPNAGQAPSLQNRVTPFSLQRDSNQAQQMIMRNSPPSFGVASNQNIRMPFQFSQQQQQQQMLMQALMFQNPAQSLGRLPSPRPSIPNLPVNPYALGLMALSQSRQRMVPTQQANPPMLPQTRSTVPQQNTFQRSLNPMELIAKAKKCESVEAPKDIQEKVPQEKKAVDPLQLIATVRQLSMESSISIEKLSKPSSEQHSSTTNESVSIDRAELKLSVPLLKEPVSPSSMVRTFHGNVMIQGTKQGRHYRNVLNRMEDFQYQVGPLSIMYRSVKERLKVKVWIRSATHVRGICTGYIVAFDKHWNLAMADVDEVFRKPKKRREKVWRNVHYIPEVKEKQEGVYETDDLEGTSGASLTCENNTENQEYLHEKTDAESVSVPGENQEQEDKETLDEGGVPDTNCEKQQSGASEERQISHVQGTSDGITDQDDSKQSVENENVPEMVTKHINDNVPEIVAEKINDIQDETKQVCEEGISGIGQEDCDSDEDNQMIIETEDVNLSDVNEKDLEAETADELDNLGLCENENDELDIDVLTEQLNKIRELLETLSSSEEESEEEVNISDIDGMESCNSDAGEQDIEARESGNDEIESNNSDACRDETESNTEEVDDMEQENSEAGNELIENDGNSGKSEGEISDDSDEENETQNKMPVEKAESKKGRSRTHRKKSSESSSKKKSHTDGKKSSRSEKESAKSSSRVHHSSSRSTHSDYPHRRSSHSDSQRSRTSGQSDRPQRRSSLDEDQYSRRSTNSDQSQRRSSHSDTERLRSQRRSSHSDNQRSSRSPHSDDQRSPQRRSHRDDQSRGESSRSYTRQESNRKSHHRSYDKSRKETDTDKKEESKSYDLRTKLLRKHKMSSETKLKKEEDKRHDRKHSPQTDRSKPSRSEEEKYSRHPKSSKSDSRIKGSKNYSTHENESKYKIKDRSIPPDCSVLKKDKGGQIILQRHVNQMFIRGDNVVMVAIAPWF